MARYLGIEVTDSRIKGAVLKTAYKKLVLEGVTTILRAPGPDGLAQAVGELMSVVGSPLDGVYAAMPGRDVSLRTISLPRAVHRRGDKGLLAELEGTVPFNIDEALVASQELRGGDPVTLLAAAVLLPRAQAFVQALAAGGGDPREVGVGPVALGELAELVPELGVPGPVVLVNASESQADVAVFEAGAVVFARTLTGLSHPVTRARALRQTLAAYRSGHPTGPVAAWLTGDEAHLVASALADACELPADAVGPLPNGSLEVSPTFVTDEPFGGGALAVAMAARGLGRGRRMDLRRGPLAVGGGAQVLRDRAPYLLGAAAALVVCWGFATFARYQGLAAEKTRLETTLGAVTQEVFGESVTDPDQAISMARGEGAEQDQDPLPPADAYDAIGVLSTRIAPTIRHDVEQLDINGGHVQLQGVVDTLQDRDRVLQSLQQYPCFGEVRPGRATTNPGDNRQKYTLDIAFRCPEQRAATNRRSGQGSGAQDGNQDRNNNTGGSGGGSS